MSLKQLLLLLIGFMAGLAAAKSYPMTTALLDDGEHWQATFEVTNDPEYVDAQAKRIAVALQQQANRYPRETLVLSCSLKTQEPK